MTEQPPGLLLPARTGPDVSHVHVHRTHLSKEGATTSPSTTRTACAERRRRQGPPAATRSGSARTLTPPPHWRATDRVEGKKNDQPTLLTDPAPSGMTCVNFACDPDHVELI